MVINQCVGRNKDFLSRVNQAATKIDVLVSVKITLIEAAELQENGASKAHIDSHQIKDGIGAGLNISFGKLVQWRSIAGPRAHADRVCRPSGRHIEDRAADTCNHWIAVRQYEVL